MNDEEDVDRLGEELYSRICNIQQHQETAGKLTGMLLELPCPLLVQLLQDDTLFNQAVEKASKALQAADDPSKIKSNEDNESTSSDSLGERLFELVDLFNTGCSQKITGMLLEQRKDVVMSLISDQTLLAEQVTQAQEALKQQTVVDASDTSGVDDAEQLGETLFLLVEQINQDRANDITGMLLEMDRRALHQLLCDQTMLKAAVQKALSALENETTERL